MTFTYRAGALALVLTTAACGGSKSPNSPSTPPPPAAPTVASVAITGGQATLSRPGQATQLRANATMSDGTTQDVTASASWTSSAPQIATVAGGNVTAAGNGDATITATHSGRSGQFQVRVAVPTRGEPRITGGLTVTLSPEAVFLYRARLELNIAETGGVWGLNLNFINVQWKDYTGANMGGLVNYNPGDISVIWGNNHVGAGQTRTIGPRIDYNRAVSRVTVDTVVSLGDDLGNQFTARDTFAASITLRPVILPTRDTREPQSFILERTTGERTSDDSPR